VQSKLVRRISTVPEKAKPLQGGPQETDVPP
jgi:hypothetical protein